ncbi:MAG: TRAP transporter large permease [Polaromonas sp.]|uniref:TRAP transporter large permease n=1 Tax=Polaromonas sp. TaxID=1869339 RepID=UPI00273671E1|nr:TRAP transporter large permease [Polaromonas sp.]MDP3795772.1 TRAP transporter large permease [Polaromonas sp.]
METSAVAWWMFATLGITLMLRIPVAFALGLACIPALVLDPTLNLTVLVSQAFSAFNSFILLAVPFFLLAAHLMNSGGITDKLFALTRTMVGHFPGSLAQVNVVLSVMFAGISGSSTADAASQSKLFVEAQVKEGYDLGFSVAVTAVSSVLAVVIPPSILMIVWGGTFNTSISALYLAGFLPGILLALAQMGTVYGYAKARNYPKYERARFKDFLKAGWFAIPALLTPAIIVGGKLFGWFTATESAAVAVLYSMALVAFLYRALEWPKLREALLETGKLSSVTLFCLGTASVFGWLLAYYRIPQELASTVTNLHMGALGTAMLIAGVFLVVGCFLDAIPAIVIVGTVLEPLAKSAGVDPVHFGIVSITALAFGLVTPPYGLCLLISCAAVNVKISAVLKDVMIMLVPMLLVLLAIILLPDLFLFLPRTFGAFGGAQ